MANALNLGTMILDGKPATMGFAGAYLGGKTPAIVDTIMGHELSWVIVDNKLIANHCLLRDLSFTCLRALGLAEPQTIHLDGRDFIIRLPQVGQAPGLPNEWDSALDAAGDAFVRACDDDGGSRNGGVVLVQHPSGYGLGFGGLLLFCRGPADEYLLSVDGVGVLASFEEFVEGLADGEVGGFEGHFASRTEQPVVVKERVTADPADLVERFRHRLVFDRNGKYFSFALG